jgi:NitT/TauT family transport system ATP-binding protein
VSALQVEDVSIAYRGNAEPTVKNVSLSVDEAQTLILIGRSGCGKSTLLRGIAGFEPLVSGEVRVGGARSAKPGPDKMVVFQQFDQLLPWKTAQGNVAFAVRRATGCTRSHAAERAQAMLDVVGLGDAGHKFPAELSGGMQQRVAIARALGVSPRLILMDEPFGALDAMTRSNLQGELLRLSTDYQMTTVFVTHSIHEAIYLGHSIALLSPRGTLQAIYGNPHRGDADSPEAVEFAHQIRADLGTGGDGDD